MAPLVKDVHVQDLAVVLDEELSSTAVADACRRFEVEESVVESVAESTANGLRELVGTGSFNSVLAYLLAEGDWTRAQMDQLNEALDGSPLSVRETAEGKIELIETVSPVADRSVPDTRAMLEAQAPDVVMTQIESAEANLAAGEYELAAAEIRRAMDMLAVAGFDEGLEELAEQGLIQLGDEHEHSDATMLYVAYGYCSFLGGDPELRGFETGRLQAELALVVGEEVLRFLIEVLNRADEQGIELRRWERP